MKKYLEIFYNFFENRNLVPKLASILLAVILWAYITSAKSGDIKFKIPVNFEGLEESLIVSKISHKVIVVELRGNKDDLKNIRSANIKLVVDLTSAVPGEYNSYKIEYQKVDFTDDFKIDLYPEEIKILIEKKTVRNVKIVPRYSGNTQKGFMTGRIRVNPEYVTISGARSVVNNIDSIFTEEISVDDKNLTFRQDVKIDKISEHEIEYNLSKVNVTVPILNYSELTAFEIPIVLRNKKKGFKYSVNPVKVKIGVIQPENRNISENSYSAYVDLNDIDLDTEELASKSKIEIMGSVAVSGDSYEIDNGILSTTPGSVQIVVTKE